MTRSILVSLLAVSFLACEETDDKTTTTPDADADTDADSDADSDADADADSDADSDTDTDTDTEPPPNTIVDIAIADPDFSILVEAVVKADLVDTLSSAGPFTVFAPNNDAFAAAGITSVDDFTPEELTDILLYHVVAGEVDSASVPALADSVGTWTLFFDTTSGVKVNQATVIAADIMADNGIIHVIDNVLLPPSIVDAAGYAGLTGLAGALGAADPAVATLLSSPGDYTVFAPTNDAFDSVADVVAGLDTAQLTDVLTYHAYPGRVESTAIPVKADSLLTNAYGFGVSALFDTSAGVTINQVPVAIADIRTTNGIVHVIDGVLLPPNVVDLAINGGLTGLVDTILAADGNLEVELARTGPFTVFAPDNQAFTDIAAVAATLSPLELQSILSFHVVRGAVDSASLEAGEVSTLLFPQTLTIDLTAGVMVEDAMVTLADVHATNGVVHVIDTVMLPPSGN